MIENILNSEYLVAGVIIIVVIIIPFIIYLITIQNTFKIVSDENRKMPPGNVWIALIPVYGVIWHFFIVNALSESLRLELLKEQIHLTESKPGHTLGMTTSFLFAASVLPDIGGALFIIGLVTWILYWVKISGYKRKIEVYRRMKSVG